MPHKKATKYKHITTKALVLVGVILVTLGIVWRWSIYATENRSNVITAVAPATISNGVAELTVGTARVAAHIPGYYEVPEGFTAICIPVGFKNISGSSLDFIPVEEVQLRTLRNEYTIEAVPTCGGIGGTFQTGEIKQGELGFIVTNSDTQFDFLYNPIDIRVKQLEVKDIELYEKN